MLCEKEDHNTRRKNLGSKIKFVSAASR